MDIIKHLRELRAGATQGEWFLCEPSSVEYGRSVADTRSWIADSREARARTQVRCREGILPDPIADAALICAAVNHLDMLLDVAENGDRVARAADMASDLDLQSEIHGLVTAVRALREARVK